MHLHEIFDVSDEAMSLPQGTLHLQFMHVALLHEHGLPTSTDTQAHDAFATPEGHGAPAYKAGGAPPPDNPLFTSAVLNNYPPAALLEADEFPASLAAADCDAATPPADAAEAASPQLDTADSPGGRAL